MADAPKSSGSDGPGDLAYFLGFLLILFILWVITGGPGKNPSSRNNAFINQDFTTYNEPIRGQPGSVTRTIPFLK